MMMMAGGGLWAWDISTLEDLRRKVRGRLGIEAGEGGEGGVMVGRGEGRLGLKGGLFLVWSCGFCALAFFSDALD